MPFPRIAPLLAGTVLTILAAGVLPAREVSRQWALEPVLRPELPPVKRADWPLNSIDRFILERLEREGLGPAPEATRACLIRRLSFDLLGLPPSPEEVAAFEADSSSNAYERLVDRLLASPHHGERWARHWLDVARFCESHGFEYDKLRPNAWHYRDYLIRSFNADKPYDVFVKEQIAGDVLGAVTRDGIVATSFLVCGPWDEAGNLQANATLRAVAREDELEDLISAVSQTFLGMTANCARCHAHKFDPIPQEDYYRLRAVFSGVRHGERPLLTPSEAEEQEREASRVKTAIAEASQRLSKIETTARRTAFERSGRERRGVPPAAAAANLPRPILRWTFDRDANDVVSGLASSLEGGAELRRGRLVLPGKGAFLKTAPLPRDVREKTLEAWVALSSLEQGGGAAISIETPDGSVFDAIVFGERQRRKWVAGSNVYERTRDLDAPEEDASPGELVHVALVCGADNRVAFYRNGKPYGSPYSLPAQKGLITFKAGASRVLIGLRHTGGGNPFLGGEVEEAAVYDRALSPDEVAALHALSAFGVSDAELSAALPGAERAERERLLVDLARLRQSFDNLSGKPMTYAGVREQPAVTRRLLRGDVLKPAEEMAPSGLSAVREPRADLGLPPDAPESERRLRFAEWLADARNPLTARVIVNRLWHHHFGQGIVPTPNDFGAAGARPSHPDLLDWLASELVESGWSLKSLHRTIVTSATYRQASAWNPGAAARDADNQLVWRFTPRRLEAEELRDTMLAASGRMNWTMGGPSFRDFEVIAFPASEYAPVDRDEPELNRRSIYRMNVQSGKSPFLEAFDCPEPSVKTPRRGITTTPIQALGLMNGPFSGRQAAQLAARARREGGGTEAGAVERSWRLTLGRAPSPEELAAALETAAGHGLESVCWALFNSSEFLYAD